MTNNETIVATQAELESAIDNKEGVIVIASDEDFVIRSGAPMLVIRGSSKPYIATWGKSKPDIRTYGNSRPCILKEIIMDKVQQDPIDVASRSMMICLENGDLKNAVKIGMAAIELMEKEVKNNGNF